jgi:hypothetical protein
MESKFITLFAEKTFGKPYPSTKYQITEDDKPQNDFEPQKIKVSGFAEKQQLEVSRDLSERLDIAYINGPLFKYFLDGSRRCYKIADMAYDKRIYPVFASQIAVACIERKLRQFKHKNKVLNTILSFPKTAGSSQELKEYTDGILKENPLKFDLKIDRVETYHTKKSDTSYENRAMGIIQQLMVDKEKEVIIELANTQCLDEENYLLKDGSLEYGSRVSDGFEAKNIDLWKIRSHFQRVVGVSKKFNPEILSNDPKQRNIANDIANLPEFHRTPAFKYQAPHTDALIYFAVWYVRIRKHKNIISPYDGIIKVEKILVTDKERDDGLDSGEIDNISANLIIERNPTTYGKEARWHNHLYPIYVTENFMKSLYHTKQYFMNAI